MPPGFLRRGSSKGAGPSTRHAYECLRNLLDRNTFLLEQMSEIEADLGFYRSSKPHIQRKMSRMADESMLLAEDLNVLSRGRFLKLYRTVERIRSDLSLRRQEQMSDRHPIPLWLPLRDAAHAARGLVGNKAGNLGRVLELLPDHVPAGFVVTTEAYWRFLHQSGLGAALWPVLRELEAVRDPDRLQEQLRTVGYKIRHAQVPKEIESDILRESGRLSDRVPWAARSSAEGEDGRYSFAGQFESLLNVPSAALPDAYRRVIESRFRRPAFEYRRALGLREIDTPMAVLFLEMIDARSAGVLYTRDPAGRNDRLLVQSVWGLGRDLMAGTMDADRFVLSCVSPGEVLEEDIRRKSNRLEANPAGGVRLDPTEEAEVERASLDREDLRRLWEIGQVLEKHFGMPLDVEWVIDSAGKVWIVQVRRLVTQDAVSDLPSCTASPDKLLLEGGVTIHAGRTAGPLVKVTEARLPANFREGAILVAPVITPEIASLLPVIGGCIAETGNPAGHAASLLREWKVPSLFGVEGALRVLENEEVIGLDATHRKIYRGSPWPEPAEKKGVRDPKPVSPWDRDPLCRLVFPLRLTDPASPRFRAEGCRSLHDIVRFVHEKAVESLFDLGDSASDTKKSQAKRLQTDIPLNIVALDLGRAFPREMDRRISIEPSEIASGPFQAFWRGISDPKVSWAGRRHVSLKGFSSVLVSSISTGGSGSRRMGDRNYLLASRDYMNMNLRLAYHYSMVDALVGESPENNFVNFRFRGGGAGADRRELRARFLSETLLRSRFSVDRRGDLITAWFRRFPRNRSEEALEMLGRLLACSRQLDMMIRHAGMAREYAERFLAGEYEIFG
jgi:pyruvate, water dikinase